jgi:hypothetical protein
MALNQAEWYEKLKGFVPKWWFEKEETAPAIFQAMASVFADAERSIENNAKSTFILQSEAEVTDAHGDERNVERLPAEADPFYRERIRNIVNNSNYPTIKALVDSLLINGECVIREHFYGDMCFFSRENFMSRGEILTNSFYNVFSIIVDNQLHEPYSFLSRENFLSREDFYGSTSSDIKIFEQIVAAVNKSKAFGVLYRLLERAA